MINQNVVRGLVLGAVALAFGVGAVQHSVGTLARPGPGLFPIIVSSLLLLIAVLMLLQSRLVGAIPMQFNLKNVAVIMSALVLFVFVSRWAGTLVATVALVFVAALAGPTYSWKRNIAVAVALILIAIAFQKLLGLNLRVI